MSLDYERLERTLARCAEIAEEPGMKASVVGVYDDLLKEPSTTFRDAHTRVTDAEGAGNKESSEAVTALDDLDQPFREARAVAAAYQPHEVLPETLKSVTTDTDKQRAIEKLVGIIDKNEGAPWATNLAAGDFGTKAPKAIKELRESIAANKVLAQAKTDRAAAFGPAYEQYLAFKWVVREALGSKSKQYKRIHVRDKFASGGTTTTTTTTPPVTPPSDTSGGGGTDEGTPS